MYVVLYIVAWCGGVLYYTVLFQEEEDVRDMAQLLCCLVLVCAVCDCRVPLAPLPLAWSLGQNSSEDDWLAGWLAGWVVVVLHRLHPLLGLALLPAVPLSNIALLAAQSLWNKAAGSMYHDCTVL